MALRWGKEEKDKVKEYLNAGKIDLDRVGDARYLASLKVKEEIWKPHKNRNFYQNIRRAAEAWREDEEAGHRRDADDGVGDFNNMRDRDEDMTENSECEEAAEDPQPSLSSDEDSEYLFCACFLVPSSLTPLVSGPRQQARQRPRNGLTTLEHGILNLQVSSRNTNEMLIGHYYQWMEAVDHSTLLGGMQVRLERLSVDILLPGPTSLSQVECEIIDNGTTLQLSYTPPVVYFSSKRTAARVAANQSMGDQDIRDAVEPLLATARTQAHESALVSSIRKNQTPVIFKMKLPFAVDEYFCGRNEFGNMVPGATGIDIAFYDHESDDLPNQFVWMLHLEMTSKKRPKATPQKVVQYKDFRGRQLF